MKLTLILLAAGDSRRFQENKLLYQLDGKPMYRHIVDQLSALPVNIFHKKIVVSQYPEILTDLEQAGYQTVENKHSSWGISYSVWLGVDADEKESDAYCFAVCDQPFLKSESILRLVREWAENGKGIGCLVHGDELGNPVIYADKYREELLALEGDRGGKQVLRRHLEDVYLCSVDDAKELRDIDYKTDQ